MPGIAWHVDCVGIRVDRDQSPPLINGIYCVGNATQGYCCAVTQHHWGFAKFELLGNPGRGFFRKSQAARDADALRNSYDNLGGIFRETQDNSLGAGVFAKSDNDAVFIDAKNVRLWCGPGKRVYELAEQARHLGVGDYKFCDHRHDLFAETRTAEDAIVPYSQLQVMQLLVGAKTGADIVCGFGLANA